MRLRTSARAVPSRPRRAARARCTHVGLVRQQHQLVRRVKPHQLSDGPPRREQRAQPAVGEDALDEVLAQPGIAEPAFLFDRQRRHARPQRRGIEPGAGALRHRARRMHLHPLHPAARRVSLQHVPGEVERGQRRDARASVGGHAIRPVGAAPRSDHPHRHRLPGRRRAIGIAHQVHGLARRSHPDLDLRAHRHPLHIPAERLGEEAVALVAAVEADLLAEQAGRDADADGSARIGRGHGHGTIVAGAPGGPRGARSAQ